MCFCCQPPRTSPRFSSVLTSCYPVSQGVICQPVWNCGPPWVGLASSSTVKSVLSWFVCITHRHCFGSIFDSHKGALGQVFSKRRGGDTCVGMVHNELPGWETEREWQRQGREGQEAQQRATSGKVPATAGSCRGRVSHPPAPGKRGLSKHFNSLWLDAG